MSSLFPLKSNVIVALAAFWVNFCLLGVLRSNAVIFRALVDVFEVNREDAAWPSGIFGFFMCVTGALSGFLSHHIRIRNLAMFGAALASTSVSFCCLASHMNHIIYMYGALQGIGVGMIVPLTHVVLNQNFTKYRALALGIAYSGSSAGSFIFPPLTNVLVQAYGLPGTFLLLGSIMLNSLVGVLFFRTPGTHVVPASKDVTDEDLNKNKLQCDKSQLQSDMSATINDDGHHQIIPESEKCLQANNVQNLAHLVISTSNSSIVLNKDLDVIRPETPLKIRRCSKIMGTFHLALEILSSPYFIIVSLAYAVYFSTSAIFLMVILDYAKDRGVPLSSGVFLVSAFSAGDFAGRLSFGWIADIQCIRRNILVRLYMMVMGMLTALLSVCPVKALSTISVLFGVLNGSVIVNHSVLLNEYLGLEKLPLAIGFSTCLVGLTAFLRPLVIGVFRDRNQSYDCLFIFIGLLQIAITTIWFLGSFVQFMRHRSHSKNGSENIPSQKK